jgi:hypothetical protein
VRSARTVQWYFDQFDVTLEDRDDGDDATFREARTVIVTTDTPHNSFLEDLTVTNNGSCKYKGLLLVQNLSAGSPHSPMVITSQPK